MSREDPQGLSREDPQSLFVGYDDLRNEIVRGLKNGKSYAMVGGHKCGGTAFMCSLNAEIAARDLSPFGVIRCFLDMNAIVPRSPFDVFREIHRSVTQNLAIEEWTEPADRQHYQEFLGRLHDAVPLLESAYGPRWLAVLIIDSIDDAAPYLKDDECFQNLRHLLVASEYRDHFRLIARGVAALSGLVAASDSPLNNLYPKYLRVMTDAECRSLIQRYWPAEFPAPLEALVVEMSGRHPYLTYGILRYLQDLTDTADENSVRLAASRFVRDRLGVFRTWTRDFNEDGRRLYAALLDTPPEGVKLTELKQRVRGMELWDETLLRLSYHCVIDDSDPSTLRVPGRMFKNWFRENCLDNGDAGKASAPAIPVSSAKEAPPGKKVFVVHGRNAKIRTATFGFLRSLGLEPLEWHEAVEATGNPAPHISQVLEMGFSAARAAIVLLTPDDEAHLRAEFRRPEDPTYESELTPQPRPNVLFEAGMAFARFPHSTILVQAGAMRPFSDIAGIHLLVMNNSYERRKEFVSRLKMAGCQVDESGTGWHTEGDFSI